MRWIQLSGPDAPPVSELLRDVPLFADLPAGEMACVRQIRQAVAEQYADGEAIAINGDLIVTCSGSFDSLPGAPAAPGSVLDRFGRKLLGASSLTARGPVLALRFHPSSIPQLTAACPRIAAALARA